MCGAPVQGEGLDGVDVEKETIIQGVVVASGAPVSQAYVRLLDSAGEFTGEVRSSATGQFRFFVRPGEWTVRALSRLGNGQRTLSAERGVNETELTVEPV